MRTAETIFVGDAASLIRAANEAAAATEGAEARIKATSPKVAGSFTSMSGAGKAAAKEIESSTGRIGSAFAGIATSGNVAVAGIAAIGTAVYGIKKSADTFEEIGKTVLKLHNLTGLSIKSASQYAAVAKVNEINVKGLTMAFTTLSKNVQAVTNAHDGLTKSAHTQENAFKTLGLPLKDVLAAHGNLNKLLPQVVGAFERLPGSVNKAATAQALFGRGAKELVPLMHSGALGLKEQLEDAEKYGASVGKMSANEFKKWIKSQDEAKFALLGLQMTIGKEVAPALSSLIKGFAGVVSGIRSGSSAIDKSVRAIGSAFAWLWNEQVATDKAFIASVNAMASAASAAAHAIGGAFSAIGKAVSSGIRAALNAVKGFFNGFYDVGKYLVEGLKKGVEAGAESVVHAVTSPIEGAISLGEEILESKSPSKKFHKLGMSVGEGFAAGVHASTPMAHDAVKAMASSTMSVQQQIVAYFVGKGLTPAQAAGIAGNAGQESSYNPNAPGGGLFQTIGGRGVPQGSSVPAQLNSAWSEMISRGEVSGIKRAKSPQEAARIFEASFERAGIPALSNRERYAGEAFAGYHGGGSPSMAAVSKAIAPHVVPLKLSPAQQALIGRISAQAGGAQAQHMSLAGLASGLSETWTGLKSLQDARSGPLGTARGNLAHLSIADAGLTAAKDQKVVLKRELAAVHKEAAAFRKERATWAKIARGKHGKAKAEAVAKAEEAGKNLAVAEGDAKALGGQITTAETGIVEAGNALAALPGEIQGADLSAYQASNAKVDAEARAGLLTPDQAQAAKTANANKALSGGYGSLSEEGRLSVMGDLKELAGTVQEANKALEEHNQLQAESNRVLGEFVKIGSALGLVEASSLAKSLADTISGQIAGVDYHGQRLTAGVGTAARY